MEVDSIILRTSPIQQLLKMVIFSLVLSIAFALYSLSLHNEVLIPFSNIIIGKTLFLISGVAAEALTMIAIFLRWSFRTYEINSTELICKTGIIFRSEEIHSLKNIQSVYIKQGFFQTLFGYGTIQLHNPLSREEVCIKDISDPNRVAHIVQGILAKLHNKTEIIVPQ